MKTSSRLSVDVKSVFKRGTRSWHNRILSLGLCCVFVYASVRLIDVVFDSLKGAVGGLLVALAGVGLFQLWQQRQLLKGIQASEADRLLGYLLILSGVALYPFCLFAVWAQAIACIVVLLGIACSQWGLSFFQQCFFSASLIAVGILPNTTLLLQAAYGVFMPPNALEIVMAWGGSIGLSAMGLSAVAQGSLIIMPAGSVRVAYGCNGLYMAATMAIASLVLGLFLKQGRGAIALMMVVGAALALVTNVPRIMLMAIASAYWDERWFHFWHDSWGGQIFVSGLLTIYYYIVMALVSRKSTG